MSETWGWLLGALAVWRLTHALWAEAGPFGAAQALRRLAAALGLGALFDCFYCLSLWVALPVAAVLLAAVAEPWLAPRAALAWLGLSGAAIVIERLAPPAAPPTEENPP